MIMNSTTTRPLIKLATKALKHYVKASKDRQIGSTFLSSTVVPNNITSFSNTTSAMFSENSLALFCSKSVKTHEPLERIFYGYALPCLCLLGVVANVINMIVLTDRRLSARTYTFLAFLAFTDLVTLILYFIDLLAKIHFAGQLWHEIFTAYVYLPIGSVTTTSSLMFTVAFTIDRFIHLRDPRNQMGRLSIRETNINRIISSGIMMLSAVINIPRIFALYVDMNTGCRAYRDYAKAAHGWFGIYSYTRLTILNLGSIILMAVFNALLIVFVHRSSARSHRESARSAKAAAQHSQQRSLTLTLIAATLLALAGEIPSTLLNRTSAAVIWGSASVLDKQPFRSLILLAYTLLLLEYSGNFVTYFLLNKRFHALLCLKLCPSWAKKSLKGTRLNSDVTEQTTLKRQSSTSNSASSLPHKFQRSQKRNNHSPNRKTTNRNNIETEPDETSQALATIVEVADQNGLITHDEDKNNDSTVIQIVSDRNSNINNNDTISE